MAPPCHFSKSMYGSDGGVGVEVGEGSFEKRPQGGFDGAVRSVRDEGEGERVDLVEGGAIEGDAGEKCRVRSKVVDGGFG